MNKQDPISKKLADVNYWDRLTDDWKKRIHAEVDGTARLIVDAGPDAAKVAKLHAKVLEILLAGVFYFNVETQEFETERAQNKLPAYRFPEWAFIWHAQMAVTDLLPLCEEIAQSSRHKGFNKEKALRTYEKGFRTRVLSFLPFLDAMFKEREGKGALAAMPAIQAYTVSRARHHSQARFPEAQHSLENHYGNLASSFQPLPDGSKSERHADTESAAWEVLSQKPYEPLGLYRLAFTATNRLRTRWRVRGPDRAADTVRLDDSSTGGNIAGPVSPIKTWEEQERIADLFDRADLDGDQKKALLLNLIDGLSETEIAARLGIPLGTVRSRLQRAKKKVRQAG